MRASRTHVVDLGTMPREELIDIAKKQASQIREKNMRLSSMEAFIESLTGAPVEESLAHSPEGHPSLPPNNSSAPPSVFSSPPPGAATVATTSAPQRCEQQPTLQEEQLQHTLRVSQLEEQLRERQREYEQLQTKVDAWKAKVMTIMTADQERIRSLEALLAAAAAPSPDPVLPSDVLSGVLFRDASAPPADAGALPIVAPYQQQQELQSEVIALRQELCMVREELQQARSQLQEHRQLPLQPQLPFTAAPSTPEKSLMTVSPAVLGPEPSPPSAALSDNALSVPPVQITASDIPPNVLQEAVHAKLAPWRERAESAMLADKRRIEELEAKLAALEVLTNAGDASKEGLLAEAEVLRAEVSGLQMALQTAQRDREALLESARSEVEECRAAFKRQITELQLEVDLLRAAVDAAQLERDAAVSASAAEHAREAESLRADISRLQEELDTAVQERDNATITLKGLREKMEEWKAKVRDVVEDGESQRRALEAEVRLLKEQQFAAAARVEETSAVARADNSSGRTTDEFGAMAALARRRENWSQTDVVTDVLASSATRSPVAAAVQDVAVQATLSAAAAAPLGMAMEVSLEPTPMVPVDRRQGSAQDLLAECERVAVENERLLRVVAQLSRFRAEVMREVRAAAAPSSFSLSPGMMCFSGTVTV
ncbi:hypothetical protein JKF63_06428 [Porcisia hertigi]|uniref:Uncharacterized protein n=1 Tax=Porcisia hertigi TaxID=2761500 RepID=A0A836LJX3_9TRYP|nr:hypothetical protein JKF63_06428 [Porcisia hertigi]